MELNVEVAMAQYKKRKEENSKKEKIDNASLYAGSPMYYYCKFCECLSDEVPESYFGKVKTVCDPCRVLHDHGLI